jgi:hypothetical protein
LKFLKKTSISLLKNQSSDFIFATLLAKTVCFLTVLTFCVVFVFGFKRIRTFSNKSLYRITQTLIVQSQRRRTTIAAWSSIQTGLKIKGHK